MKNTLNIIYVFFFCFFIISCAKEDGSSSSSASTMSTPSIADGNYKATAISIGTYYSDGTHAGSYTFQLSHDSSVTPGYYGMGMEWKGSGVYRITEMGKVTISASGSSDATVDCSTNNIADVTLDSDGNLTDSTTIQTGCGGGSSSLTLVSAKFTAISGGMSLYMVQEDSSKNQYRSTYAFQKQSTSSSSTTELEGTWKSSCVSSGSKYKIRTLTVSGTNVTADRIEYHSDSSCANDEYRYDATFSSLSIGDAMTFDTYGSSGGSGHRITMTIDTNTFTSLSASDVTWSNSNSWCGETDWVLNTAQSIAGKTCDGDDYWNTNITIYGLYLLDGNKLFLNLSSGSYPSGVDTGDNDTLTKQ